MKEARARGKDVKTPLMGRLAQVHAHNLHFGIADVETCTNLKTVLTRVSIRLAGTNSSPHTADQRRCSRPLHVDGTTSSRCWCRGRRFCQVSKLVGLIGSSSAWQPTIFTHRRSAQHQSMGRLTRAGAINLRKECGSHRRRHGNALPQAREQGLYQQILAMDDDEAVGTAHLGRLFVGGYAILKLDFLSINRRRQNACPSRHWQRPRDRAAASRACR